jgi:hypothetical protein
VLYDGLLLHDPIRERLLTIWELGSSVNTRAFIRTYPDLTRFPDSRFFGQVKRTHS